MRNRRADGAGRRLKFETMARIVAAFVGTPGKKRIKKNSAGRAIPVRYKKENRPKADVSQRKGLGKIGDNAFL